MMAKIVGVYLLAFISAALCEAGWKPQPNPQAVVTAGNARFTIFTPQMVRMEYSPNKRFEDAASITFVNRFLEAPSFSKNVSADILTIKTSKLTLTYNFTSGAFSEENLQIIVADLGNKWYPGLDNSGNLLGTLRTLDEVNGSIELNCTLLNNNRQHCNFGLVSRLGWVLVDDTQTPLLRPDPVWQQWADSKINSNQFDWYFFGHGHEYRKALFDFTLIAGKIPLPPRFAFGIFFSRYWAYSQEDLVDLIQQYENHNTPLDTLVTDMDWHETFYKEAAEGKKDQAGQPPGWTGFTWDDHLFPNPKGFLEFCKNYGLHNTLNIHPASGVQPFEERYPQMAVANGINPATKIYVPFNITNTTFATTLHDIMLHPIAEQGIDFWWLDWQQWGSTDIFNLNPTFWLNYVFFNNFQRINSPNRGMLLHRWGGLGNHRYQIGFSGDVIPSWSSLNFQVYFTATATNVGYGYWSHDIGGHILPCPPELYTRWIQWGAFSPAFRPHCTKDFDNDRRIWVYPQYYFHIMRNFMEIRSQLVPYLYTSAKLTHDTGVASIVTPLYYDHPKNDEAYEAKHQYKFGTDMMVAPVTAPMNPTTNLSTVQVWLPEGKWFEWWTGAELSGPRTVHRTFALDEMPVYVKSGAIVPYFPLGYKRQFGSAHIPPAALGLWIFPGNFQGSTSIYEDGGDSTNYDSQYSTSQVEFVYNDPKSCTIRIEATRGSYSGNFHEISYEVKLVRVFPAKSVMFNGVNVPYLPNLKFQETGWEYEGDTQTVRINLAGKYSKSSDHVIKVEFLEEARPEFFNELRRNISRAEVVKQLFDEQWGIDTVYQEDYPSIVRASTWGKRVAYDINSAVQKIKDFPALFEKGIQEVRAMTGLIPSVKTLALAQLLNQN